MTDRLQNRDWPILATSFAFVAMAIGFILYTGDDMGRFDGVVVAMLAALAVQSSLQIKIKRLQERIEELEKEKGAGKDRSEKEANKSVHAEFGEPADAGLASSCDL